MLAGPRAWQRANRPEPSAGRNMSTPRARNSSDPSPIGASREARDPSHPTRRSGAGSRSAVLVWQAVVMIVGGRIALTLRGPPCSGPRAGPCAMVLLIGTLMQKPRSCARLQVSCWAAFMAMLSSRPLPQPCARRGHCGVRSLNAAPRRGRRAGHRRRPRRSRLRHGPRRARRFWLAGLAIALGPAPACFALNGNLLDGSTAAGSTFQARPWWPCWRPPPLPTASCSTHRHRPFRPPCPRTAMPDLAMLGATLITRRLQGPLCG